jgi:hypothetical protein
VHDGAVERSGNPFLPLDAEFKKPFSHGACVRHAQVRAKLAQQISKPQLAGEEASR